MKKQEQENNTKPATTIPGMSLDDRAVFVEGMSKGVDNELAELLAVSVDPTQTTEDLMFVMAAVAACRASILTERLDKIRHTARREIIAKTQREIMQQLLDMVDEKPAEEKHEAGNVTDVTP